MQNRSDYAHVTDERVAPQRDAEGLCATGQCFPDQVSSSSPAPPTATPIKAGCSDDMASFLRQPPITRHGVGVIRVDDASQGALFG